MTDHREVTGTRFQTKDAILEDRMIVFAANTIKTIKKCPLPPSLAQQLIRSSSSIGANYAEARNASSKSDFRNKIYIAKKEAAETRYWLRLCMVITLSRELAPLYQEANELLLILQAILNALKRPSDS